MKTWSLHAPIGFRRFVTRGGALVGYIRPENLGVRQEGGFAYLDWGRTTGRLEVVAFDHGVVGYVTGAVEGMLMLARHAEAPR